MHAELLGHAGGEFGIQAAFDIDVAQFGKLGLGHRRKLLLLAGAIRGLGIGLRTDRNVFAGRHRKRAGYQARQARYALANGGLFGQGLGQSRAKWNYLPNAHNDFIFAIIGEELGLLGGLTVIALFVLLAFVGLRIALRAVDPFLRMMTAAITVLISVQALINIGYVIGLLPVTGIQLPLLSAGGTSTFTVLVMLGLLGLSGSYLAPYGTDLGQLLLTIST